MLRSVALGLGLICLSGLSCVQVPTTEEEALVDNFELVYTVSDSSGSFVGGLDSSVPALAEVLVKDQDDVVLAQFNADENGRFHEPLMASSGQSVYLEINQSDPIEFRVRDFEQAHADAVWTPFEGMGYVPNDLVIVDKSDTSYGIVIRSGDNAVSKINLESGLDRGVTLPEIQGANDTRIPANPWFVKHYQDDLVFVTAAAQGVVYLVDLNIEQVIDVITADKKVVLEEEFTLPRAVDLDADGSVEEKVKEFAPQYPQGLFVTNTHLVVGYSGFVSPRLDANRAAVYLPAVLAFWPLADLRSEPEYLVLPHLNVQEISLSADDQLLATCSGIIETVDGLPKNTSESAVIKIDPDLRKVTEVYELGAFAASSTVDLEGQMWTGSLLRAQLQNLGTGKLVSLNSETIDSVFRLQVLPGKLVAATSFNTDRVHILDSSSGELNPPPFLKPFQVGPGRPVFDGAQILARRPGRAGVDFTGPDLFCLSGVGSRVWPIETRKLLGP